ncbi:hypothetical protein [Lentibacillus amyloliquefaciens]|uniref:Uncharacterized protein n=1 Tax=Lentibacillus amyloliquefaciens TaxID=1472767 RepID=A0A0U4G957_9BACI|nr:hypothetical protein [Lentibacillus amyloliquefaciens]ALX49290.1 hypothetical protein AOX59_12240 [Lentibacillus amyloliquefaciens]
MNFVNFVPMILTMLILGAVVFAALKFTPKKSKNNSYVKLMKWMLGIYIAVLIVSVPLVMLLPKDADFVVDSAHKASDYPSLHELAASGNIEESGSDFQQKTWEETMENQEIHVRTANTNGPSPSLYVENVNKQGNKVEVIHYRTPFIVKGNDMTHRLNPLKINFSTDSMTIRPPVPARINLTMFQQEIPTAQFTGERRIANVDTTNSNGLVYLKVPENIELSSDSGVHLNHVDADN